jgi:histidinol-phosphate aminotransferase
LAVDGCSEAHGGLDPAELQQLEISPADLTDFSVNSNPFGPAPGVLAAIRSVDISAYPDRNCSALREALAQANQTTPERILVGNGTAELIWLTAQAFLRPGDQVVILGPTFGEYERAVSTLGAQVKNVRAQPPDFSPPVEQVAASIVQAQPRLVFVCNPNNPTGVYLDSVSIEKIIQACGSHTILVLDEAYRAFVSGPLFSQWPGGNCLVLRSMTKDFALAGLRLGYIMGHPALIEQMRRWQPAWSVNGLAQAAGIAALADVDYYQETLLELIKLRNDFFCRMKTSGYAMVASDVHFGLVYANGPARELRLRLLRLGLQVRDCASFGLPEYIRISTRQPADNVKLLAALELLRKEEGTNAT